MTLAPGTRDRPVALITGAASGLARGIALDLAARGGHRIAINYRTENDASARTLAALSAADPGAIGLAADLSDPAAALAVVRGAEAHFGRVDILIAAVGPILVRRFAASTAADYRAMIDGNLTSAVACAQAVLPGMRARSFGRLIFFGMNGSHRTQPARGMSLYGAAKAGVVAFARALSLEEARHGITVNVIEPGDIRDKTADRDRARAIAAKNPVGHAGSWADVAYAVRFLIAPEAGFINGQVIGVNGGLIEAHE